MYQNVSSLPLETIGIDTLKMCRQCLFSLQKRRKTLKFGIILGKFVQCRFFLYFWVKNLRENLGKARPQFNDYFSR